MSTAAVSTEVCLELIVPGHDPVPLMAGLCYRRDDPFAIRISFHVSLGEPVEWIFARDLLAAGVESRAGEGDVQIWPTADGAAEVLNILLSSPQGEAHFEGQLAAFTGFLLRTFDVVPPDREEEFIDIESGLTNLLDRS